MEASAINEEEGGTVADESTRLLGPPMLHYDEPRVTTSLPQPEPPHQQRQQDHIVNVLPEMPHAIVASGNSSNWSRDAGFVSGGTGGGGMAPSYNSHQQSEGVHYYQGEHSA